MTYEEMMMGMPLPLETTMCEESLPLEQNLSRTESDKQDEQITEILKAFKNYYKVKSNANHCYKKIFFYIIITVLALITLIFGAVSISLLFRPQRWEYVAVVMGGGVATIVTAILKLPKIIAEHLFPQKEDQVIVNLVEALKEVE